MSGPLHLEEYKDDFQRQLQALIDAKAKGKEIKHPADESPHHEPRIINLMDALKKSLAQTPARETRHRRSA
ncbi:MAG TPA: hypothetical protein VMD30_10165, partial [Tepidisphaeraceae bacterium]|nr:hypothetical protein [Tepidisphaeraceae bacterium]